VLKKSVGVDTRPTIGFEKSAFGRRKMVEERRQHQRLVPSSPLFISLDDSKSGLLLDLCEGGLAVASLVPRNLDEFVSLGFDLPEGIGRIEAKARIAWTRDSGHLTGVRFVDLDDVSQQQLSEWISAGTNLRLAPARETAEPVFVTRSTYAQVDAIPGEARDQGAADFQDSLFSPQIAGDPAAQMEVEPEPVAEPAKFETGEVRGPERGTKSRYTIELFLAVVLLSWALVFLGYQMGSTGVSRQNREGTAAPKVTEAASKPELASVGVLAASTTSAAPPSAAPSAAPSAPAPARGSARASAGPAAAASLDSGMVLQVGAMKLEDNAAALAQDLRKKKFPAMVFRHGHDRLYRVAVGPYSDAEATAKVKDQLEKQGFKPMVQRWSQK
jgi:cell division septation protein DedD